MGNLRRRGEREGVGRGSVGQASGVPSPPPPPPPRTRPDHWGEGGGGWRVRRGVGAVGAAAGRNGQACDKASIVRKPYASHKSYNVAQ